MNVLSLFDGIAGARAALDRLGIECTYYASEIDKYAISIAQRNYPDICQLGDVKLINPFLLPEIDLLIGGSPCQDLSLASHSKSGLGGERSGLFFEYLRLLRYIKPKYFLLENVASMSKLSCWTISQYLGVEPIEIDSSLLSGQSRKRLYWTNILGVTQPADKNIYLKDIIECEVNSSYAINLETRNFIPIKNRSKGVEFLGALVPEGSSGLWPGHFEYYLRTVKDRYRVYSTEKKSPTLKASLNNMFYVELSNKPKQTGYIEKNQQGRRVYSLEAKSVSLKSEGGGWGAKMGLYMRSGSNPYVNSAGV